MPALRASSDSTDTTNSAPCAASENSEKNDVNGCDPNEVTQGQIQLAPEIKQAQSFGLLQKNAADRGGNSDHWNDEPAIGSAPDGANHRESQRDHDHRHAEARRPNKQDIVQHRLYMEREKTTSCLMSGRSRLAESLCSVGRGYYADPRRDGKSTAKKVEGFVAPTWPVDLFPLQAAILPESQENSIVRYLPSINFRIHPPESDRLNPRGLPHD